MKKVKLFGLVLFLAMASFSQANAQELGIRFGNFYGNNVAVDGVFALGQFSRVHADVSFGGGGVGIDALWNPIYRPVGASDFNYYLGFGPSMFIGDPFSLGVAGEIGIEYPFNSVPIVIGADWRPNFRLIENTNFFANQFGLNIRWRFGK
ncbi:hypothetical protein J2X69_004985 [Algoriphagus sp. 4150]|uniref:outer membrane insertion C- signal n=1 Tax=Algoriphagus sp. 4150 TaxID=2817756 RepID=UPI002866B94A|nr:outer membrane insertion C- signal [Algoriphagus sp. 4150]MDR7132611.1 hypothetical protein [Algoriphagus sp. 4150]